MRVVAINWPHFLMDVPGHKLNEHTVVIKIADGIREDVLIDRVASATSLEGQVIGSEKCERVLLRKEIIGKQNFMKWSESYDMIRIPMVHQGNYYII